MDKYIVFVGDSFCGSYSRNEWEAHGRNRWQMPADTPAWPSLLSRKLGLNPRYHGYCGKSWWYSRYHFFQNCRHLLANNKLEVVIFCHTDPVRTPTKSEAVVNVIVPETEEEKILAKAQDMYRAYLFDNEFGVWARNSWIKEIKELSQNIPKVIQFNCFNRDIFNASNYSGMCYNTPLDLINAAQYSGNQTQAIERSLKDHIPNHFTVLNNVAMTDFIASAIDNYQPGVYDIDISKFHLVNDNVNFWVANKTFA